ncbi:MAG: hypothetical protein QNJ55_03800 [Xenococcus sp. MO_188.B8]|nr:hypothetical protein [Xenococcus sp. MO_188.B8]
MYTNKTHKLTLADKQHQWYRLRQLAAKAHENNRRLSRKIELLKIASQETKRIVSEEKQKAA